MALSQTSVVRFHFIIFHCRKLPANIYIIIHFSQIKLYHSVIDDVIANVRDSFLDEGVDEQVLQEMKQVWTSKLMASKAVETTIEPIEPQPTAPAPVNNTVKTKVIFICNNVLCSIEFTMNAKLFIIEL